MSHYKVSTSIFKNRVNPNYTVIVVVKKDYYYGAIPFTWTIGYIFLRGRRHSAGIVPLMLWYVLYTVIVVVKITTTGQSHLDGREEVDHQCKSVL